MPIHNSEIAAIFNELADLLEIEGANPFRIRAYRNAAITVADLPESLADKVEAGKDLFTLPTIGKDLAAKTAEIVATNHLVLLDQLEKSVPGELTKITAMPGLGPKRVKVLHEQAGVVSLGSLRAAAMSGRARELSGFGEKTERMILRELDRLATS